MSFIDYPGNFPVTVIPIDLAVPATIFIADPIVNAFKSTILSSAMVLIWSQETLATFFRLGSPEPFFVLVASNNCTAAGGVLITKSNDLSL